MCEGVYRDGIIEKSISPIKRKVIIDRRGEGKKKKEGELIYLK